MATTETRFLRTPGEVTIPPEVRLNGTQHGGVAILLTRITLTASDNESAKALTNNPLQLTPGRRPQNERKCHSSIKLFEKRHRTNRPPSRENLKKR